MQKLTEEKINELSERIHQMNVDKGFWDSGKREVQQITNLNISEISEALESYRKGEEAVFEIDGKPEGWVVEVADMAIRILDAIGGKDKIELKDRSEDKVQQFLYNLTDMSMKACGNAIGKFSTNIFEDNLDNFVFNLKGILYAIDLELEEFGFSLIDVIENKLDYNATRAYKHGKKF